MRSAASGGASSGNGAGRAAAAAAARADGGRKERALATERVEWSRGAGRRPDQVGGAVGRGAPNAGVRPPRGRRGMGQGGCHAREREGRGEAGRAAGWTEREEGRPSSACPLFFFFEILFSNSFQNHLDYLKITFTFFSQKQGSPKTKPLQLCFNKQDQIPNRI